jgi:hypothetical protein
MGGDQEFRVPTGGSYTIYPGSYFSKQLCQRILCRRLHNIINSVKNILYV